MNKPPINKSVIDKGAGLEKPVDTARHIEQIKHELMLLTPDGGYWNEKISVIYTLLDTMMKDCRNVAERIKLPDGTSFIWPGDKQ